MGPGMPFSPWTEEAAKPDPDSPARTRRRAKLRAKLSSLRLQGLHGDYGEAPAALKLAAGTSATATAMCRQWKAIQGMPRELAQASLCREVANLLWS